MRRSLTAAGFLVLAAAFMVQPAEADNVLKLVMPGPLAAGHAKLEADCTNCHERTRKVGQRAQCLSCHKAVAQDIARKRGYHGRAAAVAGVECRRCHTEHKGRKADIVGLERDTFDHDQTDYRLRGAHRRAACTSCHQPRKKFRAAPHRCLDCHASVEPHKGRLGKDCRSCHNETAWSRIRFDHKRRTGVGLSGKHRKTACNGCHAGERYKGTPKDCYACHRLNDAHAGRFGRKCGQCHTTSGWKGGRFDHDRDTRFPLRGGHKRTACTGCHTKALRGAKPARDCYSCHRNDDTHKGRNGRACARCHNETRWSSATFDHGRDTRFPLRGKHAGLACTLCHRGSVFKETLGKTCIDCHAAADVHRGKLGRDCNQCHNERGWDQRVAFDHDITRFPLIGQHAVVPCEECHVSKTYKGTEQACIACHRKADSHKGRLGTDCARCHNPNGWRLWRFDHNTQTTFRLTGAHDGLTCTACHVTPVRSDLRISKQCGDCHRRDDVHRGSFGRECGKCHGTKSFRGARLR